MGSVFLLSRPEPTIYEYPIVIILYAMKKYLLIFSFLTSLFGREYIAIIDFEPIGVSELESKALTQRLTSEMIELGEYQVVERSEMKRLMEEQKFQYSGCVDLKCAVDIGKLIGAKYMVVGSVSKIGSTYSIDSRMISVESGESYSSGSYNHQGEIDDLITEGMKSVAHKLCDLEYKPVFKKIINNNPQKYQNNLSNTQNIGAQLIIESKPEDALVYINSNLIGNTPLYIESYPVGSYNISISKEHYNTINERIDFVPYGKINLSYDLECADGAVADCYGICNGDNPRELFCYDHNSDGIGNLSIKQYICTNETKPDVRWVQDCQFRKGQIKITDKKILKIELINLSNGRNYEFDFTKMHHRQIDYPIQEGYYNLNIIKNKGLFKTEKIETTIEIVHDEMVTISIPD